MALIATFLTLTSCAGNLQTYSIGTPADPLPVKVQMSRGSFGIAIPVITSKRTTGGWRSLVDLKLNFSTGGMFGIVPNGSGISIRIRW